MTYLNYNHIKYPKKEQAKILVKQTNMEQLNIFKCEFDSL